MHHNLKRALAAVATLVIAILAAVRPSPAADTALSERDFGPIDHVIAGGAKATIFHNIFLIDGRGGPTRGPMDIRVEDGKITKITRAARDTGEASGDDPTVKVIDLGGHYVLPGFVNSHGHLHSRPSGERGWGPVVDADYVAKLWLAHGITSVREVGNGRGAKWLKEVADRAADGDILSPRLYPYLMFNQRSLETYAANPAEARKIVRQAQKDGMIGIKFIGAPRQILVAAIDEAEKLEMRTTMHHAQTSVTASNVMTTSEVGLDAMEHWYGLPEALFHDRVVQDYSPDYVYEDEQDRFGEAGQLWRQAAPKGHAQYEAVMQTLLDRDFHMSPTFSIYIANRDWMRARNADWHSVYTTPGLWDWFRPSIVAHGSYWFDWTQDRELDWRENFGIWMKFVNEYKNRGGLVAVGEDAGYIYSTYGFGYIQEMELLREAGFHPLEVIRAATLMGARILGREDEFGTVEEGKRADLVILEENPLQNLKVLYGTGHVRMDRKTGAVRRVGGVKYTVKDGIIYDAAAIRTEIADHVRAQKAKRGLSDGPMPVTTE